MKTEVVKRDGSLEDYDEVKIVRVATATGLEPAQAQTLAAGITKWIKDNLLSKITTLQIRDKVLEDLKVADAPSADLYLWYEQTKDDPKP